jgi:streptogramin lyase
LQGKVDDGLPHSPIANAVCRFTDRNGTQLATTTADSNGLFQLAVPLDVDGFLRCAPPALSNLRLSAFVSTAGRQAGDTIANLTVTPATTMVADILATTSPPDIQARATALTNALAAGDADLTLLADAETTLYNAQLANRLNVDFSGGSEGSDSGDSGGGGSDGAGATGGDSGGTGGDAGDGGAFSPIPGAVCDFSLTMDGPMVRTGALADFLATGTVNRPDLQTIAPQVNAAFAGRQAVLAAAFRHQFSNGLGRALSTTADANGTYFLRTPPGVQGFVRCHPPGADNLVLTRFVRARRPGERLMGQDVTPATTVISRVVTQAIRAGLDPVPIQDALLASIAPLTILLPDHPNGNGMFATVQLTPGATLSNPDLALLVFTATTIFDAMRQQRASIPANVTFAAVLTDYFQDAAFQPALAPLAPAVNTAVDQGQAVLGLGRSDISAAASTATLRGTVTDPNGAPLAGVLVVATQQGATVGMATTDANGAFALADVPPGSTTVTASLGLAGTSVTLTVIAVPLFPLNLTLTPAPHPQLFVSSQTTNAVLRYDGQTGAFLNIFAPTAGSLALPRGLVFGPDGNLYASSFATNEILRYDGQTGAFLNVFVSPMSGGLLSPTGLVFGPDGNLYVGSSGTDAILRYDERTGAFLGTFVIPGSGGLVNPQGLVFGPDGNLYVAYGTIASGNQGILRYDGRTGAFLNVFGGNNFGSASALAFGPDGNLYIGTSISTSNLITRYDGQTGVLLNTFNFGNANSGRLSSTALVFGPDGKLYISGMASGMFPTPASASNVSNKTFSFSSGAVFHPALANLSTGLGFGANAQAFSLAAFAAGSNRQATGTNTFGSGSCSLQVGPSTSPSAPGGGSSFPPGTGPQPNDVITLSACTFVPASFSSGSNVGALTVSSNGGNSFVTSGFIGSTSGTVNDLTGNVIVRLNVQTGAFFAFVPQGSGGLDEAQGIVFGSDGNLYANSGRTNAILRYDGGTGAFLNAFVPSNSSALESPTGLVLGPDGNLYVISSGTGAILRYDGGTGAFRDVFVPAGSGGLGSPQGLVFGPDGNLYVSGFVFSTQTSAILRYDGGTGAFRDVFVSSLGSGSNSKPVFGPDGNLYINSQPSFTGTATGTILRFDGRAGAFLNTFVSRGSGGLGFANDVVFGPDGNLYVLNVLDNGAEILRYDGRTGAFLNVFISSGSGGLQFPDTLRFGPDGNLYVSDSNSAAILRFDGQTGAFLDTFVSRGSGGLETPAGLVFLIP